MSVYFPSFGYVSVILIIDYYTYLPDKTTACSINSHHPIKNTLATRSLTALAPEMGERRATF